LLKNILENTAELSDSCPPSKQEDEDLNREFEQFKLVRQSNQVQKKSTKTLQPRKVLGGSSQMFAAHQQPQAQTKQVLGGNYSTHHLLNVPDSDDEAQVQPHPSHTVTNAKEEQSEEDKKQTFVSECVSEEDKVLRRSILKYVYIDGANDVRELIFLRLLSP
jgi:hypothetical protein